MPILLAFMIKNPAPCLKDSRYSIKVKKIRVLEKITIPPGGFNYPLETLP